MTLVVEDGTGKSNANAFCDVAFADTHISDHGGSSSWTALDTSGKETAIILGARFIEQEFQGLWKGQIVSQDQALAHPRYNLYDEEGRLIGSDTVAIDVQRANAELAREYAEGNPLGDTLTTSEQGGLKRKKVVAGPVESEKEWFGGSPSRPYFTQALRYLQGLLITGGSTAIIPRLRG